MISISGEGGDGEDGENGARAGGLVFMMSCRFTPCKRLQCSSQDKCCTTYQMISYHMLNGCDGSGGALRELLVPLFGFLHPRREKQI